MLERPQKVEIHKFEIEGKKLLLDVRRSISMEIDEVASDILDAVNRCSSQEIISTLKGKYSKEKLVETLEELEKVRLLVPEGKLPSPPRLKIPSNPKIPINCMDFNISHDCTMHCRYCYGDGGNYGGPKELMHKEVAKKAVDFFLANSGDHKKCEIIFFGGEPLLNMPVLKFVVNYARKEFGKKGKIIQFGLTTNATLLMVDPAGDLYVCHRCAGTEKLKVGDLKNGIDPLRQRRILENYVDNRRDCATCWARYLCGGSCIANNVVYYDDISCSNPLMCSLYKYQLELGMWFYSEIHEEEKEFIQRYCEGEERPYMKEVKL